MPRAVGDYGVTSLTVPLGGEYLSKIDALLVTTFFDRAFAWGTNRRLWRLGFIRPQPGYLLLSRRSRMQVKCKRLVP